MNYGDLFESVSQVDMDTHLNENRDKKGLKDEIDEFKKDENTDSVEEGKVPDGTDDEVAATKKLKEGEDEESSSNESTVEEGKVEEMEEPEDPRVRNAMLVIMGRAEGVKEDAVQAVLKAMADANDDELMMSAVNSFRGMVDEPEDVEITPEPEPVDSEEIDTEIEEPEESMEEGCGKKHEGMEMEEGCPKKKVKEDELLPGEEEVPDDPSKDPSLKVRMPRKVGDELLPGEEYVD